MRLKSFIISTIIITLGIMLTSCSNSPKNSRNIIGELTKESPKISNDFSKFSGTDSYKFTISDETTFKCSLKLRTGKTSISLVDEIGNEYLNLSSSSEDSVTLAPDKEATYYVDLKYDNGVGSYSIELN